MTGAGMMAQEEHLLCKYEAEFDKPVDLRSWWAAWPAWQKR